MTQNLDKTAKIIAMHYVASTEATTTNFPGQKTIEVQGYWIKTRAVNITYKEDDPGNGEPVEQQLQASLKGLSTENEEVVEKLTSHTLLIRLDFNNGVSKVIGTEDDPVILQASSGDTPYSHTLSFKRNSAEKAKTLL